LFSSVPTNRFFQCLAEVPPPVVLSATDNCDTNVTITLVSSTNGVCPLLILRCWTASDDCSNTVTVCQTNFVQDTTAPVLAGVPANQTYQCLAEVPLPAPVTATDNCDTNPIVTLLSTTNGVCPITITRRWTALDRCTNSTVAIQSITVQDTLPPVLSGVPTNAHVQCLAEVALASNVSASDNCDTNVLLTLVCTTNGICPL